MPEKVGRGHSIGECVVYAALVDAVIVENKEADVSTLPGQEHAEPARRLGDVRLSGGVAVEGHDHLTAVEGD